jgi:hypothetical protein
LVAGLLGFFLFDVVQIRLIAWINPWRDPTGGSYQIIQALLAVASGEFMGKGPGLGNPGLVPVPHSDFIFSSIVEETGLIGAISILLALAIFTGRGFLIAINAPGVFRRLLAVGLTVFLVGQSILIIGGNIRLFPLTGVTLPFVSYGGSSLVVSFLCLGLLLVISNSGQQKPSPLTNPRSYLLVAGFLLAGLLITGLLISWWSIIQRDALLGRTDLTQLFVVEDDKVEVEFNKNQNQFTSTLPNLCAKPNEINGHGLVFIKDKNNSLGNNTIYGFHTHQTDLDFIPYFE